MTPEKAWETAIEMVGGQTKMAREIGVSRQRLSVWRQCHPEFVLKAEAAIAKAKRLMRPDINRFVLRPDLYQKR